MLDNMSRQPTRDAMFDFRRFLDEQYGSSDAIVGLLNVYRLRSPSRDTVRKWFERATIPAAWLPVLLAVKELDSGEPVALAKYLGSDR